MHGFDQKLWIDEPAPACEMEPDVPGIIEMSPFAYNRAGTVTVMEDNGSEDGPKTWSPSLPSIHAMKNQALNFVKHIKDGVPVPSNSVDAVKDLKVAKQYIDLLDAWSNAK